VGSKLLWTGRPLSRKCTAVVDPPLSRRARRRRTPHPPGGGVPSLAQDEKTPAAAGPRSDWGRGAPRPLGAHPAGACVLGRTPARTGGAVARGERRRTWPPSPSAAGGDLLPALLGPRGGGGRAGTPAPGRGRRRDPPRRRRPRPLLESGAFGMDGDADYPGAARAGGCTLPACLGACRPCPRAPVRTRHSTPAIPRRGAGRGANARAEAAPRRRRCKGSRRGSHRTRRPPRPTARPPRRARRGRSRRAPGGPGA
jgi:hypothetical protein